MIARPGRKKGRGAGPYRPPQDANRLSQRERHLRRLVITFAFLVLVVGVTQKLVPEISRSSSQFDFEAIPPEDIMSDRPYPSVDLEATRRKREQAVAGVPEMYDVARDLVELQLGRFENRIDALESLGEAIDKQVREALLASNNTQDEAAIVKSAVAAVAERVAKEDGQLEDADPKSLAVWLEPDPKCVPKRVFEKPKEEADAPLAAKALEEPEVKPFRFANLERLSDIARSALEYTLWYGVLNNEDAKGNGSQSNIVIQREFTVNDLKQNETVPLADAPLPARAREQILAPRLKEVIEKRASEEAEAPVDWEVLEDAALQLAGPCVGSTLNANEPDTADAKQDARDAVEPVDRMIPRNFKIQEGGIPWEPQAIEDYKRLLELQQKGQEPLVSALSVLASNMLLVALIMACLVRSMRLLTPNQKFELRDLSLTLLIMCATVLVGRVALFFDPSGLAVPVAAGAILLAILIDARLAAWASFLTSALLSIQYGHDWQLLAVNCATSFAGVLSIFVVRRRNDMASAAFKAMLAGLVAVLAITLATDSLFSEHTLRRLFLMGLNGAMCMFIVPGLLSPLERLFGITTDIQLLEYSDLNNELLSRLAIEVPATHAHSQRLGELAEAAAAGIGANGLLARVCAYYHDIGKLRRPEYFSENQTGPNIHDELSPRLSARAISSHVSEGVEMAREFHLPKPIIDGILEHHGTSLISFFYKQAVAQQKHGDVQEADFRYPGPKPQRRETAILMICDAVESGVRSIKNPNEERVREFVDKVITGRANDRQFDECGLTLKELDTIKDVVTKRVLGALHSRIAYPDEIPKRDPSNIIPMSGGMDS